MPAIHSLLIQRWIEAGMSQNISPFRQFPRAKMFSREIILAAAITLAAFFTFLIPHESKELVTSQETSLDASPH